MICLHYYNNETECTPVIILLRGKHTQYTKHKLANLCRKSYACLSMVLRLAIGLNCKITFQLFQEGKKVSKIVKSIKIIQNYVNILVNLL